MYLYSSLAKLYWASIKNKEVISADKDMKGATISEWTKVWGLGEMNWGLTEKMEGLNEKMLALMWIIAKTAQLVS
jgi:hypothetical protein